MIKVLLQTDIKLCENPDRFVMYASFWAILERSITEEDKTAVVKEIEKIGDGFIQALPKRGKDPTWIRASAVNRVCFFEVEETE